MTIAGYYNDDGKWVRTKQCLGTCPDCNCKPPLGLYQIPQSKATVARSQLERMVGAITKPPLTKDPIKGTK